MKVLNISSLKKIKCKLSDIPRDILMDTTNLMDITDGYYISQITNWHTDNVLKFCQKFMRSFLNLEVEFSFTDYTFTISWLHTLQNPFFNVITHREFSIWLRWYSKEPISLGGLVGKIKDKTVYTSMKVHKVCPQNKERLLEDLLCYLHLFKTTQLS